jgi:hypothetical protein
MSNQNKINVGDRVRVLSGSHAGEVPTVGVVTPMSDHSGPYARVRLHYAGGGVANKSTESVEKVYDYEGTSDWSESKRHE